MVYKNGTLEYIQTSQGRIIPGTTGEYQYYLTDHLGNIRTVFTTRDKGTSTYLATMESENATTEGENFVNLTRVTSTAANHTPGGNEAQRLNNSTPVGVGISLPVYPGDALNVETYAYYEGGSGYSNTIAGTTMISSIAAVFGGISGGSQMEQAIFDGFDAALSGAGALAGTGDDNVPAAYLNYIVFNKDMGVESSGFLQISGNANFSQEQLSIPNITIEKPGYIYVYVSNESNTTNFVYFDDLKVELTPSNIEQNTTYYPYSGGRSLVEGGKPINVPSAYSVLTNLIR